MDAIWFCSNGQSNGCWSLQMSVSSTVKDWPFSLYLHVQGLLAFGEEGMQLLIVPSQMTKF